MSEFTITRIREAVLAAYRSGDQTLFHYIGREVVDCPEVKAGELFQELKRTYPLAEPAARRAAATTNVDRLAYGLQAEILANELDVRASNPARKNR